MKTLFLFFTLFISINTFAATPLRPIKTVVGTTGAYTVPAGKWARVLIDLSATAYSSGSTGSGNVPGIAASSVGKNIELFLKSGDALTFSNTNASGTATCNASNSAVTGGVSLSTVSLNGTVIASARAGASAACGVGNTYTTSLSGATSSGYVVSEYYN